MAFYAFVKHRPNGEILGFAIRTKNVCPYGGDSLPVTDKADIDALNFQGGKRFFVSDGKISPKPVVTLAVDKTDVAPGEIATVTFSGIPDSYPTIKVRVGDAEVDLPRGEVLEVESATAGTIIEIALVEPLIYSDGIIVRVKEV